MNNSLKSILFVNLFLAATQASSMDLKQGHFLFEAGGYKGTSGKNQNIYIQDLLGDRFNVTDHHHTNGLFGLGYLIDGSEMGRLGIDFGLNAFYFLSTEVSGTITQEFLFTNLAYHYKVSHLPVYATAKAHINTNANNYVFTIDAGIGPNVIKTSSYRDWSIDNGVTLPDRAFSGRYTTAFSAMTGVGLKVNDVFGHLPLECGYRFFYLGKGHFNARTDQIQNNLNTGNNYANALLCTVTM